MPASSQPAPEILVYDDALEDKYTREVLIGAKILTERVYNLMLAIKAQVKTFSKQSDALLKLRQSLMFSSPFPKK